MTRVHRPTGPWTPAVHALLAHLNQAGLDGIPQVLGIDDAGREVLDYLPGDTLDPESEQVADEALAAAAAWMRRFHDAVRTFEPGRLEWRQGVQELGPGEVICHNDPGLYNWVVVDGGFAGMIDWDRAGPGRPIDDLAFLCWSGVPLLRELPVADAARRVAIAAAAYGDVDPNELLDAVDTRMGLIASRWRAGIERGDPGTLALRDSGIMDRHHSRVAGFDARRERIREQIRVATNDHRSPAKEWSETMQDSTLPKTASTFTTLTDGGIETALVDRLGQELPEFAAFVLLDSRAGREALHEYYRPFIALAAERRLPLVLDTPTWRANADWGARLGYDAEALARVNQDAVALVRDTIDERVAPEADAPEVLVNGCVGPRYDEYVAEERMTAEEAERYHAPQVRALAEAGADRVTSVTTLDAAEAIGVVNAATAARVPSAVSFIVEPNGRLADGSTIAEAIAAVDAATGRAAEGFLLNCAHPSEARAGLAELAGAPELARLIGFRLNAGRAGEEGAGDDPETFAAAEVELLSLAPDATALGGCCGTDTAHIAALAGHTRGN